MNRALAVACAVAVLTAASLMWRSASLLTDRPFTEDGFYVLSIARHAASGRAFTIDGSTRTNGFQPLYTLIVTGAALVTRGDRVALLRAVYVLEWAIYVAAAAVLGQIAAGLAAAGQRRSAFLVTATIYLSLRLVFLQHFNGLETGLLLLIVALLWRSYQREDLTRTVASVRFGALLGLLVLTRLDAVFLAAAAFVLVWLRVERPARLRAATITLLLPAVLVTPWLVYSFSVTGTLMPSSGLAQQAWDVSGARWLSAVLALGQVGVPIYLGAFENPVVAFARVAVLVAASAATVIAARRLSSRSDVSRRSTEFVIALWAASLALMAWYASSSWATHFYVRYAAPLVLVSCLAGGLVVSRLLQRHRAIGVAVVCALVLQSVVYAAALHAGVYAGSRMPRVAAWSRPLFLDQLRLVETWVPPNEVVAAGQSGTLGYFRDLVVNVDGKVNAEALRYQQAMTSYLDLKGIDWFCDMPSYVERYLGARPEEHGWSPVAESGLFRLYRRIPH